jgi:uncharacterized protein (TIGR03000 family)
MSHSRFLTLAMPAVAALALLFSPGALQAAGRGGHVGGGHFAVGHVGVGHVGVGHVGVGHVGIGHVGVGHVGVARIGVGHVGGGFRGGYGFRGYGYRGLGYGLYGGGYGYPSGSYGSGYYSGSYGSGYYAAPYYADDYYPPTYVTPSTSIYVTPSTDGNSGTYPVPNSGAGGAAAQDLVAHVTVQVPPDAEVWFGQGKTKQTGAVREFVSPSLTPGQDYTYTVKARWVEDGKEVVQSRQIDVSAGSRSTIDFTKPGAEGVEPPKPKP